MSDDISYLRGAFIAYEPGGYPTGARRVLPFRFNPEQIARSLSVDQGKSSSSNEPAKPSAASASGEQAADAASGALKQSFTVQVRFDAADRQESAQALPSELGIAPELAALEDLLYPSDAETEKPSDGKEPVKPRPQRPTVLFVWGRKRVLPIRITGMQIHEELFNAELNPTRAEVDVAMDVLGEGDAKDNRAVQDALQFTAGKRRELSQLFLDTTAAQGTNILPL